MPNKTLKWRDYQREAVAAPIACYREGKRQTVLALPTGAGKTLISGGIFQEFLRPHSSGLIVVPRLDLVAQTYQKYTDYFFEPKEIGIIQGTTNELGRRITIASKDTLDSTYRLQQYLDALHGRKPDVVIFDEAHLFVTDQGRKIKQATLPPWGMLVGLSATPYRADGQSLAKIFPDGLSYVKDIWDLIRDGHLVDIESYDIDMGFDPDELIIQGTQQKSKILDRTKALIRYTKAYDAWWHLARTKRTVFFGENLADACGLHEYFSEKGVSCAVVTGRTSTDERDIFYPGLRTGSFQLLSNFGVLTTGNDIEEIECIIMGRTTNNLGLWTQMIGRGLRLAPHIGKEKCLVLNLTGTHHTLLMFNKLFGTTQDAIPSMRALLKEKEEKEKQQFVEREEEERQYQIAVKLGQITARPYNMLIGDGWREQPVVGDWVRDWTYKGKPHQLVAEKAFTGGYQPVHLDAKGRRHVLSDQLLTLPDAQRRCQEYASTQEHQEAQRDRPLSPEQMRAPVTDEQFAYLQQRNVCIKNAAGKTLRTMSAHEIEDVKGKITLADYGQIVQHMKTYKTPYSKIGGNIGWFEGRGVRTWPSSSPGKK